MNKQLHKIQERNSIQEADEEENQMNAASMIKSGGVDSGSINGADISSLHN